MTFLPYRSPRTRSRSLCAFVYHIVVESQMCELGFEAGSLSLNSEFIDRTTGEKNKINATSEGCKDISSTKCIQTEKHNKYHHEELDFPMSFPKRSWEVAPVHPLLSCQACQDPCNLRPRGHKFGRCCDNNPLGHRLPQVMIFFPIQYFCSTVF